MYTDIYWYTNKIAILMKFSKAEEYRRTKILEYVGSNQGCNVEDVVRGVKNYVSRVTVFKILSSLKHEGAITRQEDKLNRRDHKLFVDNENPLISLPKEFDEFKKYYYPLLETVRKEVEECLSYSERDGYILNQYFGHLTNLGLIFGEFIRIYNTRAFLVWPKQIKDIESLRNLYMLLFSQVLEIRGEISKVFRSLFSDLGPVTEEGIFGNMGLGLLGEELVSLALYNIYEHNDIETETNRVIDHISGIWKKDRESYALKIENFRKENG